MDIASAAINALLSIAAFIMFAAGVLKLFQIHTVLGEVKDVLQAIRANGSVVAAPTLRPPVPAYSAPAPSVSAARPSTTPEPAAPLSLDGRSGEEMLRELDAQMRLDEALKSLSPESAER